MSDTSNQNQLTKEIKDNIASPTTSKNNGNSNELNNQQKSNRNPSFASKQRKKRKTSSCSSCRAIKTRCDFQPLVGKCHRCNVLKMECSLTQEREKEILDAIRISSNNKERIQGVTNLVSNPVVTVIDNKINNLENDINRINQKLDFMISFLHSNTSTSKNPLGVQSVSQDVIFKNSHSSATSSPDNSPDNINGNSVSIMESNSKTHHVNLSTSPLNLLNQLDEKLFSTKASNEEDYKAKQQRPFVVARNDFMQFFNQHEKLCLDLSRDFLVKAHFWIIPGGIKKIDGNYVEKHAFITSVFAIVAMGFDENNKCEKEQEILYPIVERLLTNTLTMFDKLIDHDIEAILYCCMFTISRKSKRYRQLKFNSLVLSNFAIDSLLTIIDFYRIKDNVVNKLEYNSLDLYHLRILNSLTACKLEYSASMGKFSVQSQQLKEFNNLTAKFPQATFGDDIKISEINLGDIVNGIFFKFGSFLNRLMEEYDVTANSNTNEMMNKNDKNNIDGHNSEHDDTICIFPELEDWLRDWHELSSKDGGGVLLFSFDFYHIMICRTILTDYCDKETFEKNHRFFVHILNTMSKYCFSLLNGFLKLPPSLIKGAPSITLHQTVYSCLTLCDFLHCFNSSDDRQKVLNMCTKIYWHLNTIGEKLNEATENVGIIIKSLLDTSKVKINNKISVDMDPLFVRIKQASNSLPALIKQQASALSKKTNASSTNTNFSPSSVGTTHTTSNNNTPGEGSAVGGSRTPTVPFNMPDVTKFESFEDFFQDFFYNLQPTSQHIFS
ncbi:related to Uracil catabolism protein 2 [Saccharomycodes ludwigii]|uniref:Related to Uracil catabolism protein 2 n=1 Tax=Saccharomycodes ludwigii TaxID=36035 RepID=A0A376B6J8_9ASCO|nr:hypothetical protein SCDLUD_003830 [Saccharomycodes ludwigii]KAH3899552.1 hypothetical protein SCDLUD_003830 [Saccharomycodes ludwigii]SSD60261.1 related to Uracil catabolism protein 2 [Saccharomycodes ludwigii]